MKLCVIIGCKKDKTILELISSKLCSKFSLTLLSDGKIERRGTGEELIVFQTKSFVQDYSGPLVIILNEDYKKGGLKGQFPEAVCIISSSCKAAIADMSELKIPTFTCGMRETDALCASSVTQEGIMVCLQREIETVSGKKVEPFEAYIKEVGPGAVFAAEAAMLADILLSD